MADDRFCGERYDEGNHDGDGIIVRTHKRDIGDNTYLFIHINNNGHALTTVSKMEWQQTHRVRRVSIDKYHYDEDCEDRTKCRRHGLEGDFGPHLRENCPDKGICTRHAVT